MNNNNILKFPTCPQNVAEVNSVDNVAGIKAYKNSFVYVTNINTVFFIDNQRRITTICAMPLYKNNYDYQNNPLGLRSQTVYDFDNNLMIIYGPDASYRLIEMKENINA